MRRSVLEVTSEVQGSGHPCHHVPTKWSPCINLMFKSTNVAVSDFNRSTDAYHALQQAKEHQDATCATFASQ